MVVAELPRETVVVGASGLVSVGEEVDMVEATANELSEVNQGNSEKEIVVGAEDVAALVVAKAVALGLLDMVLLGVGKVADVAVDEGPQPKPDMLHVGVRLPLVEDEPVGVVPCVEDGEQSRPRPNTPQLEVGELAGGEDEFVSDPAVGVEGGSELDGEQPNMPSSPQPDDEVGDNAGVKEELLVGVGVESGVELLGEHNRPRPNTPQLDEVGDVAGGDEALGDCPVGDPAVVFAGAVELLGEHNRPRPNKPQLDDVGEAAGGDEAVGDLPAGETVGDPPAVFACEVELLLGEHNRPRPNSPQLEEVGDAAGGDEALGDCPFGAPVCVGFAGGVELLEGHNRPRPNNPQLDGVGDVGGGSDGV